MFTVKMIMVDKYGDEVVVDTFKVNDDLDEDYMEVWESMKIEKARQRYPEAYGFYFEDSRNVQKNDYSNNEWEEKEFDEMVLCDDSGICCAGMSCPMYWKCQH